MLRAWHPSRCDLPPARCWAMASAGGAYWICSTVSKPMAYLSTVSVQTNDLNQRLANNDAFPGAQWPRSTAELSDASLNDGDDTDWHLRY